MEAGAPIFGCELLKEYARRPRMSARWTRPEQVLVLGDPLQREARIVGLAAGAGAAELLGHRLRICAEMAPAAGAISDPLEDLRIGPHLGRRCFCAPAQQQA